MRAKLILLVLATGLTAAALLVVRQERLQAVYEMTRALDRAAENDRRLWTLRIEIARRITPNQVRRMAESLGPLRPIPLELRLPGAGMAAPSTGREGGAPLIAFPSAEPPAATSTRRGA